jgi:Spy/CpxP family protein refolding chaperone
MGMQYQVRITMKQRLVWLGVVLVIVGLGVVFARAYSPMGHRWYRGGPLRHIARELDLSRTQKSQIKSIWQAEKPAVAALAGEFAGEDKEMDSVSMQGSFDEGKVQAIADRQGTTLAKFLVEKEKLKFKIYSTVLTPEQRAKADKLQEQWHSRLDKMSERLKHADNSRL